jgi:5-methylcytosine-specific restriction protein A
MTAFSHHIGLGGHWKARMPVERQVQSGSWLVIRDHERGRATLVTPFPPPRRDRWPDEVREIVRSDGGTHPRQRRDADRDCELGIGGLPCHRMHGQRPALVREVQAVAPVDLNPTARFADTTEGDAMTIRTAPTRLRATDTRRVKPPKKVPAPIYSTREYRQWRALVIGRAAGRCQDPNCVDPTRRGLRYADHVVELRDGGAPFDPANGMVRCASCHVRKTAAERAKRMGIR